ncbi:DNA polymerase IV [Hydromonas duriensis]|uniref:DNA polymerase IV n=1 Tax=Hydromonas duriensis TaxID=1527608 RepID=A0A4R6Y4E3_9BURK|nr:DNA polymerase IV [Hydromonas duriensis]TDR27742.1 DNA polymerase-4 [Hydromonas duriensis]
MTAIVPHSTPQRKIIHIDADCFYAAVEMRDEPAYAGQPLAVGGQADRRGVIATCNYEARAFGVRSAMATRYALRLCPHLIIVPPDFSRYKAASQAMFTIYREYTDCIEPLSLDEAYLDVTDSPHHQGSATRIAAAIKTRVKEELNLVVSAGVAPNKFLAKIASDWDKPDGLFVIRPEAVEDFIATLPVDKLFGVGPRTAEKMYQLGLKTCMDLRQKELPFLREQFGKMGTQLYQLCRGVDQRSVHSNRKRKSISVETTYLHDLNGFEQCLPYIDVLYDQLIERVQNAQATSFVQKVFVKLRLANFRVRSVEQNALNLNRETIHSLLKAACERHHEPIRLLGVGIRLRESNAGGQIDFLTPSF